jgi:DNA-binding NtrC family response regulator
VRRAACADGALSALSDGQAIDLVLSDIMLPGSLNGVELAREVQHRHPAIRVLLTSGHSEVIGRNVETNQFSVLAKPYKIDELAAALHRVDSRAAAAY